VSGYHLVQSWQKKIKKKQIGNLIFAPKERKKEREIRKEGYKEKKIGRKERKK